MGMSDRQFTQLLILLLFIVIYPLVPMLYVRPIFGDMIAFITLVIPNMVIILYLTFKSERRIR